MLYTYIGLHNSRVCALKVNLTPLKFNANKKCILRAPKNLHTKARWYSLSILTFFWPKWWMNSRPHVYVLTKHYTPIFYFDLSFVDKSCIEKINQASKPALVFSLMLCLFWRRQAIKGVLKRYLFNYCRMTKHYIQNFYFDLSFGKF